MLFSILINKCLQYKFVLSYLLNNLININFHFKRINEDI